MKILYLGNWNPFMESTEKIIKKSLEELGHEVICEDERACNAPAIAKRIKENNVDLFFFHKGNRWSMDLQQLIELLNRITCKKVFWQFDPITGIPEREMWMQLVTPLVDLGFLTNETWIRQHTYKNLIPLKQGCEVRKLGKKRKEYECDIAFTGSPYGGRQTWIEGMKKIYGDKFKIFSDVFGDDFYDLCQSAKIFVSPKFPANDYFWSNRIYKTLGAGGFMLHPRCEGLKAEYKEGVHYEAYQDDEELLTKIEYFLKNEEERKKIAKKGYEKTIKDYNYTERLKIILNEIAKL